MSSENRAVILSDELGPEIWRKETNESVIDFPAGQVVNGLYFYNIEERNSNSQTGRIVVSY